MNPKILLFLPLLPVYGLQLYGWDHSVAARDYQVRYDDWLQQGYRLVYVTGFEEEKVVRYNTIWHKEDTHESPEPSWTSAYGLTETELETAIDEQRLKQLVPVFVDAFSVSAAGLVPRFNVIFHRVMNPDDWRVAFGQDTVEYQNYFDQQVQAGYNLQIVSSYQRNGTVQIASVYAKQPKDIDWDAIHNVNIQEAESITEDFIFNQGYSIQYLSAGAVDSDETHFAALFVKKNESIMEESVTDDAPLPFVSLVNVMDIVHYANTWIIDGYMPTVTDAYQTADGSIRWGLLFNYVKEKPPDPEPNGKMFPETACFDSHVMEFMKRQRIPGANLAVLKDGKIVYSQGYGTRNVPGMETMVQGSPKVMPYTPFRIASISKPVTSLAVLRLVQEGRLGLSDKVFGPGGILESLSNNPKPCCPIVDNRVYDITVQQLMTHTAGWAKAGYNPLLYQATEVAAALGIPGPPTRDDYIFYMLGQPLQYEPGSSYAYAFDFNILASVIEEVTGQDYEESLREVALDPAGVCPDEMYPGSTQLKDVGEHEPQYYCAACPMVDSLFPSEPNKVPYAYGKQYLEAFPATSGWVASAQQLMIMLSAVAKPHCNGTTPNQLTSTCLLWQSLVDNIDIKPAYCGPGDNEWRGDDEHPSTVWYHSGGMAGSGSMIVRTDEYSYAFVANDGSYWEGSSELMQRAIPCVDAWPTDFELETLCTMEPDAGISGTGIKSAASMVVLGWLMLVLGWLMLATLI